jgi:hypothetical protein
MAALNFSGKQIVNNGLFSALNGTFASPDYVQKCHFSVLFCGLLFYYGRIFLNALKRS